MRRCLFTICLVSAIAALISRGERAVGVPAAPNAANEWVRTADGWQPRRAVAVEELSMAPALHPALVAAFQLGASLFFLLAFPARVQAVVATAPRASSRTVVHRPPLVAAAG